MVPVWLPIHKPKLNRRLNMSLSHIAQAHTAALTQCGSVSDTSRRSRLLCGLGPDRPIERDDQNRQRCRAALCQVSVSYQARTRLQTQQVSGLGGARSLFVATSHHNATRG
jgi:hypothetical protein